VLDGEPITSRQFESGVGEHLSVGPARPRFFPASRDPVPGAECGFPPVQGGGESPLPALLTGPGLGRPAQRQVAAWLEPAEDPAGSQIPVQPVERVANDGQLEVLRPGRRASRRSTLPAGNSVLPQRRPWPGRPRPCLAPGQQPTPRRTSGAAERRAGQSRRPDPAAGLARRPGRCGPDPQSSLLDMAVCNVRKLLLFPGTGQLRTAPRQPLRLILILFTLRRYGHQVTLRPGFSARKVTGSREHAGQRICPVRKSIIVSQVGFYAGRQRSGRAWPNSRRHDGSAAPIRPQMFTNLRRRRSLTRCRGQ
jgi:hypothetical protein